MTHTPPEERDASEAQHQASTLSELVHALLGMIWSHMQQLAPRAAGGEQPDEAASLLAPLMALGAALLSLGMTLSMLSMRAKEIVVLASWGELDELFEDAVRLLRDDLDEVWQESPDSAQWLNVLELLERALGSWFAHPEHAQRALRVVQRVEKSADELIARAIELAMAPQSVAQVRSAQLHVEQLEATLQAIIERLLIPRLLARR